MELEFDQTAPVKKKHRNGPFLPERVVIPIFTLLLVFRRQTIMNDYYRRPQSTPCPCAENPETPIPRQNARVACHGFSIYETMRGV